MTSPQARSRTIQVNLERTHYNLAVLEVATYKSNGYDVTQGEKVNWEGTKFARSLLNERRAPRGGLQARSSERTG